MFNAKNQPGSDQQIRNENEIDHHFPDPLNLKAAVEAFDDAIQSANEGPDTSEADEETTTKWIDQKHGWMIAIGELEDLANQVEEARATRFTDPEIAAYSTKAAKLHGHMAELFEQIHHELPEEVKNTPVDSYDHLKLAKRLDLAMGFSMILGAVALSSHLLSADMDPALTLITFCTAFPSLSLLGIINIALATEKHGNGLAGYYIASGKAREHFNALTGKNKKSDLSPDDEDEDKFAYLSRLSDKSGDKIRALIDDEISPRLNQFQQQLDEFKYRNGAEGATDLGQKIMRLANAIEMTISLEDQLHLLSNIDDQFTLTEVLRNTQDEVYTYWDKLAKYFPDKTPSEFTPADIQQAHRQHTKEYYIERLTHELPDLDFENAIETMAKLDHPDADEIINAVLTQLDNVETMPTGKAVCISFMNKLDIARQEMGLSEDESMKQAYMKRVMDVLDRVQRRFDDAMDAYIEVAGVGHRPVAVQLLTMAKISDQAPDDINIIPQLIDLLRQDDELSGLADVFNQPDAEWVTEWTAKNLLQARYLIPTEQMLQEESGGIVPSHDYVLDHHRSSGVIVIDSEYDEEAYQQVVKDSFTPTTFELSHNDLRQWRRKLEDKVTPHEEGQAADRSTESNVIPLHGKVDNFGDGEEITRPQQRRRVRGPG
jgi:hypothetical protein